MRRGMLSKAPPPVWWVDWRCVVTDLPLSMRILLAVTNDTLFMDKAARKLPVDKPILRWFARNHGYEFALMCVGDNVWHMDSILKRRMNEEWVTDVYWAADMEEVKREMRHCPWVLGYITSDTALVDAELRIFRYEGPTMKLEELPIGG